MALPSGHRLGPYEITGHLGSGGMGEVYRAKDSRLKREVAIKVLPIDVASDPERLARFQREAEVLASLNHPNIAHVYGIEHPPEGGHHAAGLVMELVEGEDLSQRIARGPIPIDEALPIAKQIVEALEAAHDAGVIHRDLKPANIKVRDDGTVKVLDFGLAKTLIKDPKASGPQELANSPTITSPAMTMGGVILGTAAYMAPEQAKGKPVDKRADIWAFGCVLYEMLTGRKAFEGEDLTDTIVAVMSRPPDWSKLPAAVAPGIRITLRRCLEKDLRDRLRDIGDARLELQDGTRGDAIAAAGGATPNRGWTIVAWAVAATLAIALGIIATLRTPAPVARVQKLHLNVEADGGTFREPMISPDGTKIVYVGRSRLWIRSLDQWQPRELPGTEAAVRPFWSPDGNWIGYFRSEALLKVPAAGGPVVRVASLPAVQAPMGAASGVWVEDGTIYISQAVGPLLRVPSGGGTAAAFIDDASSAAMVLRDIAALPGRGALLASVRRHRGADAIGVLEQGVVRIVLEVDDVRQPAYAAPGYLVFERRTPTAGLWAVAFSRESLATTGEPFLIDEGVEPSTANDGTLSFIAARESIARRLAWFSMDGAPGATLSEAREWVEGVALSKDQRRLLASASDGLWAYDTATGARSRITSNASDITPDWVDDDSIVFVRDDDGAPTVMWKRLTPGGEERALARPARFPRATADGRRVMFNLYDARSGEANGWRVAWIDLSDPDTVRTLPAQHDGARFPSISPDGTMAAYVSGETGRDEVFLTSVPSGDGKWQLSDSGGGWTLFDPRGTAVFYRALDGAFMSVSVSGGGRLKVGQAVKLFDWGAMWAPFYEVSPDGRRGVAAMPVERMNRRNSVSIMQNWQLEFTQP